jgi:DNA-binding transcriptional MerR regulator
MMRPRPGKGLPVCAVRISGGPSLHNTGLIMAKSLDAFRTISEVSDDLGVPKHVLRFWESKFPQLRPMKRGGGRRYYRPEDMELLRGIHRLLHAQGYTIKGVQKILREQGVEAVKDQGDAAVASAPAPASATAPPAKRGKKASSRQLDQRIEVLRQVVAELEACRLRLTGKAATYEAARALAARKR